MLRREHLRMAVRAMILSITRGLLEMHWSVAGSATVTAASGRRGALQLR